MGLRGSPAKTIRQSLIASPPTTIYSEIEPRVDLKTIISRIEALTCERGYLYTLALILLRDLFLQPSEIADINPREHLNIQELTLLVGLFVKHAIDFTIPAEGEAAKRLESTYEM